MKKLRIATLSFLIVFMMATTAFAATTTYSALGLSPSSSNAWNGGYPVTRSLKNSTVNLRLNTLYPTEDISDVFVKVKACVKTNGGTRISDVKTVTEGGGAVSFTIYEGYLDQTTVKFFIKNSYYDRLLLANITCYGN